VGLKPSINRNRKKMYYKKSRFNVPHMAYMGVIKRGPRPRRIIGYLDYFEEDLGDKGYMKKGASERATNSA